MARYDCDDCERDLDAIECLQCNYSFNDIPSHFIPKQKEITPTHDPKDILNAIALIIDVCAVNDCVLTCPFRRPTDEQLEGLGQCAFESPLEPTAWNIYEPDDSESPILLQIDQYVEEFEDDEE